MKVKLSESKGFRVLPEGRYTFKVMSVDESQFEDFGKLTVKLQTQKGDIHNETFNLLRADGTWNNGALNAWSFFARTCLGDFQASEIDTQDIVGHYITATVEHSTYTRTRGEHAGEQATAVHLKDLQVSDGFGTSAPQAESVDDFLDA